MLATPDVTPSELWLEAMTGFELHLLSEGKSASVLRNRRSVVSILAKHATAHHREPETFTKPAMQSYLLQQYKDRKGQGADTLYQDLRSFWTWYAREYETASPMAGIPRPKGKSALVPVLTPDQFGEVLKHCKGKTDKETIRNRAIVLLLLESGLRRAELSALDVSDIDLKARVVMVRRGKGGKSRESVFGDDTAQALWRWLRARRGSDGALFTTYRGDRLTPNGVNQLLARIGARAGVHLHPHAFRHAWAHYNLADGVREHDLMSAAGWSSPTMLARYGAELANQRALAAMRGHQVARIIRGS